MNSRVRCTIQYIYGLLVTYTARSFMPNNTTRSTTNINFIKIIKVEMMEGVRKYQFYHHTENKCSQKEPTSSIFQVSCLTLKITDKPKPSKSPQSIFKNNFSQTKPESHFLTENSYQATIVLRFCYSLCHKFVSLKV